jgi:hypothetical protein
MNGEPPVASSDDLLRWLRGLALPGWVRIAAAALMAAVILGAIAVLVHGLVTTDTR